MNFSIIIPTSDRPTSLVRLLNSLSRLKYSDEFEVILIFNGDGKPNRKLKKKFLSLDIRIFHSSRQSVSHARNIGIKHARYSKLVFLDDDVEVSVNLLTGYKKIWLNYPSHSMICGQVHASFDDATILSKKHQEIVTKYWWCFGHQYLEKPRKELTLGEVFLSANMSIRKDSKLFFNECLGKKLGPKLVIGAEDYEICYRQLLLGYTGLILDHKDIVVRHNIDRNRLSRRYLIWRHIVNGLELSLMEGQLKKAFPSFNDTYFQKIRRGFTPLSYFLLKPYQIFTFISYIFAGLLSRFWLL